MITVSNGLSLIRAPLAFVFLQVNPYFRTIAILLATFSDCIDGYLARRYKATSRFGAILDPLMDKFFVYFALYIFFQEGSISPIAIGAILSRDVSLCIYGISMACSGRLKSIVFRSVRWGKVTTALQFSLLVALSFGIHFSSLVYILFVILGGLALLELFQLKTTENLNRSSNF